MVRILIVDSDVLVQKALCKLIKANRDFEVKAVLNDGAEAVEYCRHHAPDLIFMDIKLHDVNGLQVIREIRELQPEVPICILSVYQNLDFVRTALSLEVKYYILKPISVSVINGILHEFGSQEQDYSEAVNLVKEIIDARDFREVYNRSREVTEKVLELSECDASVTEEILMVIQREVINHYFDNPFDWKQIFEEQNPINKDLLDDAVVIEMWISRVLDFVYKYRFTQRYSSVKGTFNYVDAHIKEAISMTDIVDNCHICQQYLLRLFKEQMKMSTRDYIQYRKIMMAKWYLYFGEYSTLDVAMMLGFGDGGYFSKVFKKLEHVTPHQYRMSFSSADTKLAVEG